MARDTSHAAREALFVLFMLDAGFTFGGQAGTTSANFLEIGAGPRAIAMGEAATALADDPFAGYWNPAGLSRLASGQAAFMYNKYFQDMDQQYLSAVQPWGEGQGMGISLTRLGIGAFDAYDANGARNGQVDASDMALDLAYAHNLPLLFGESLSAGAGVKWIRERLDTVQADAFALDLGLLCDMGWAGPWAQGLKAGATFRNIGTGMKFRQERYPLPYSSNLGLSYGRRLWGDQTNFALDVQAPQDSGVRLGLGVEWWLKNVLAFRLGYKTDQDIGSGFRIGLGLQLKIFQIDYSLARFGELGDSHQIAFSMRWGGKVEVTEPQPKTSAQYIQRGKDRMGQGRYYDAILDFGSAIKLDPGNKEALDLMQKSDEMLKK